MTPPVDPFRPRGKRAWTSKLDADRVVVDAKIGAGLRGNVRRREQRSYPCPVVVDLWHVTSQPLIGSGPNDARLPDYPPTDDEAAADFVSDALRHHNDLTWRALLSDERVEQTARVLHMLHQRILGQGDERAARINALKGRRLLGEAIRTEVDRAEVELEDWKARVAMFRAAVLARRSDAYQAIKTLNISRSTQESVRENHQHRDALRLLTLAVTRHLTATPDPSPQDRELWAWLTVLTVPCGDEGATLADMVAGKHWAAVSDDVRRAS